MSGAGATEAPLASANCLPCSAEEDVASDQVFVDDAPSSSAAWELSKENVLPLRAGRQLKRLNEAVARDSLSQDIALKEERHGFEAELRGCSLGEAGEDLVGVVARKDHAEASKTSETSPKGTSQRHLHQLLDIWHRYVLWTEQNFPSGKELGEILQRSLQAFPESTGEMAIVADDANYVDLWLKLANQREEPGDLFQFMYSKKIGRRVGLFYEQWSWHLVDVGNTKKASAVLAKGISNEASSIGRLEKLKADLEVRVARGLSATDCREEDEENDEPSRKTLGDLRGKGKHMTAPNVRVGPQATLSGQRRGVSGSNTNGAIAASSRSSASASTSRRPMSSSTSNTPSTPCGSGFQIFSDDNDYRDVVTDNKFASNPLDGACKSKENTQKAQAWNKVKAKQKASSIPTTPLTPAFDIHVDETGEDGAVGVPEVGVEEGTFFKTPAKTPAKTINMTHARPLSTKKVSKEVGRPLDFLERKDETKTEEKLAFCKDKVYQGLEEFSFEEIRYELWKKTKTGASGSAEAAH